MSQMTVTEQNRKDGITSSDKFYQAWEEDRQALKAQKAEKLRAKSNLGARFARRTFESFDRSKNPMAFDKCIEYINSYKDSERNCLMLVGSYGTGKTHLAGAIANRLMDDGVPVLFDTFSGHLNKLKLEFNSGKNVYLSQMKEVDMLILDDVGKEKQTDWSRSVMFDVINYRYEHLLPIVMTSNLVRTDLEEYLGGAIWSRLCEMCTGVQMVNADYRKGR